jgi:hypothetical protein
MMGSVEAQGGSDMETAHLSVPTPTNRIAPGDGGEGCLPDVMQG